jgi:hypothetical protein
MDWADIANTDNLGNEADANNSELSMLDAYMVCVINPSLTSRLYLQFDFITSSSTIYSSTPVSVLNISTAPTTNIYVVHLRSMKVSSQSKSTPAQTFRCPSRLKPVFWTRKYTHDTLQSRFSYLLSIPSCPGDPMSDIYLTTIPAMTNATENSVFSRNC